MTFQHIVTSKEAQERIDKILTTLNEHISRSQIQTWIKNQYVTANNTYVKANYKCQQGDIIKWSLPAKEKISLTPENIPLKIVYEDDDLLVINKPKGMLVHPTMNQQQHTVVNALLYHTDKLSRIGGEERPGIVHRLDKDTSGLLVVAKNDHVHIHLVNQFKKQTIKRTYEAIVHGNVLHDQGTIDAPIGRDPFQRIRMGVVENGKRAITHFSVIKRLHTYSHMKCQLETGRTHQIRVHLSYIGHPIVGDETYGPKHTSFQHGQLLFACALGFMHPTLDQWMDFHIERPTYFQRFLKELQ